MNHLQLSTRFGPGDSMRIILVATFAFLALSSAESRRIVCYFASWTVYRQGNGNFPANMTDPNLCTHINYAFVGLQEDGSLLVLDSWEADGLHEIDNLMKLKDQNPDLKILVSMGGWNEGSQKYSKVSGDPTKRQRLVETVLEFIDKYGFDGFDLDWEYPNQREGEPSDVENFVTLLGELKAALGPKGLLLTAAVAGGINSIDTSYNIPEVSKQLDMINVMAYDFHGSFETYVGHYAPLYASSLDKTDDQKSLNVAAGVKHWLDKGAPAEKLNLGLGTYGRGFALADPTKTDLYAPTWGGCNAGPYTMTQGTLGYNEICELLLATYEYIWDDEQKVPHILKDNQWVGYDDQRSLKEKVEFAKSLNLGGVMIWSLDTDDFRGICGNGKYPLLTAVNEALKESVDDM